MDDKMIIDFINNVEPDMSYGSSDGMTRAMVESAENMALINDYIVESTYEVYTEAEDKQSFFAKVKNKIHTYFVLFVNLVRKAIEKVKGFFMAIKRKLTMAMAKALKAIAKTSLKLSSNRAAHKAGLNGLNNPDTMFKWAQIGNTTFNTYEIDDKKYKELVNTINNTTTVMKTENNQSLEEIEDYIKGIRDDFDAKFVNPKPETGSVLLKPVGHKITMGRSNELDKEMKTIFKDVDTIMNDFYNAIMKSYTDVLSMLSKEEKVAKDKFSNNPKELSLALKRISKFIHTINYIKYKGSQLVASACLKMYRKSLSEAYRLLKNPPELKTTSIFDDADAAVEDIEKSSEELKQKMKAHGIDVDEEVEKQTAQSRKNREELDRMEDELRQNEGNGPIFPEDEKRIKHLKDMLNKMKKHEEDFAKEFEKAKKGEDRFPHQPYKSEIIRKYQKKNK